MRLRTVPIVVLALAASIVLGLLTPILMPAFAQTQIQTVALQPGQQMLLTCASGLTAAFTANQASVVCAASKPSTTATPTAAPTATGTPAPTATSGPNPTATSTPPPVTNPPPSTHGIFISAAELASRPMSGAAWSHVKSVADGGWGSGCLADLNCNNDTDILAGALVYARTGQASYRAKVADALMASMGSESGSRALEVSRNIQSEVIAADLIDFHSYDAGRDATFRAWLKTIHNETFSGMSIVQCDEHRPNNWGMHCGSARVAIDRYLGDTADLARAAQVFKGWLGDRTSYAGFSYGTLDWQSNPSAPVGVNPVGATIAGHNVDGVLPDDQRRAGGFTWPPQHENYVWEALQGATVEAEMLQRAGYDAWHWSNNALLRAVTWQYTVNNFPPTGDDTWEPWLVNHAYGSHFATTAANTGKNMGYTDWVFGP